MNKMQASAKLIGVQDGLVKIQNIAGTPLIKNEVIYICPDPSNTNGIQERIIAEVLKVKGNIAEAQVFESTTGLTIGDPVEQSGEMLSVTLGPGLLGNVYDGLQNPLHDFAVKNGFFLPRGIREPALNQHKKWAFKAAMKEGDTVKAGDILGTVQEGPFTHKIMAPFDLVGTAYIAYIQEGSFIVHAPIARLENEKGQAEDVTMAQTWPVKRALPAKLLENGLSQRLYSRKPLTTTIRLIDTFFPIARGGMACIPGPFGAGKTVLQNLISRYADVDMVIVVACGERAGEVVETITEFPQMTDPKTGGSLMDRTVIICNTSSMPVAAREASVYTGMTLGEYYRQMGYNVLLIADSTSRWAQAMRETSGRMEEIPGEEGFPAYLDSAIKGIYERTGIIKTNDGSSGSLTMIGTVSPAGGNFEEPVTQSTLATVKTFLGLSAERAYKRFYPAIDPLLSWSRYHDQLKDWFQKHMAPEWPDRVAALITLLKKGDEIYQMIQVIGEDGITAQDFILQQKSLMVDMVYLQQDAFDKVDISVPLARQKDLLNLVWDIVNKDYSFTDKEKTRTFFTELTGLLKNLNYSVYKSKDYNNYTMDIEFLLKSVEK